MKKHNFSFLIIFFLLLHLTKAQTHFDLVGNRKSETMSFKLINNLIILPVKINNQEFNFILDTGVSKSLLFNIKSNDSIQLNQTEKITIKGLGKGKYFEALKSKNNLFRLKNIVSPNFELYLILNEKFDFSSRMGIDIYGLIGTDLIKDFVIEINYTRKKIKFTKQKYYTYKKCKKCSEFDLFFQNRKPYIESYISISNGSLLPVKLLIDSGAGESLWLLKESHQKITVPNKHSKEFLGKGLSGNIFGKKAKLNDFKMGDFKLSNFVVSYPDSASVFHLNKNIKRNGTLGSEILKRFHVILDYNNKRITLKKNSNFKRPFFYDKSGLEIIHNGKMLVEKSSIISSFGSQENKTASFNYAYNYVFENSFIIALVKPDSPAAIIGLKENDIILEVNGKPVFEYDLTNIIQLLASKENNRIKMLIDRNGFQYTYKFKLKDML